MDLIEVLKAKTDGMPDEVVITLTTQQGRALLSQLEAERQRADDARKTCDMYRDKFLSEEAELAAMKTKLTLKSEKLADCELALESAEKNRDDLKTAQIPFTPIGILMKRLPELEAENAELRAKLANPVVLSDCSFEAVSHMAHWYSEGECVAWVSGVEHAKKQILEAGFTVKGE